jgi:CheY-like chemotaxis protein
MVQRIIGADIEVRIKAAEDLSRVFADAAQLEQVLMNLAVNARDAMPSGGTLTIETLNTELDEAYRREHSYVQPGKYVQLRVSDTGTGMDAQTQARIFEPFFTTKEIGKGTGLGLAMVYGIIKQHDGLIHVYSEVGHGTTFKIYLPVDEKSIQKEKQSAELPLRGGQEIILLAEDEEPLRELALDVLGGLGYTVMLASNGVEALELYTAHRAEIDLVMLDMVMPRMGGYEAYEQMRAQRKDVPVIFMTGYSAETVQSRFVKQNKPLEELNAPLIQKPYSVEGLGRKVREVLDAAPKQPDS